MALIIASTAWLRIACFGTNASSEDSMASSFNAGLADLAVTDPIEGGAMHAVIVYPTDAPSGVARTGSYDIDAAEGAPSAHGRFPL